MKLKTKLLGLETGGKPIVVLNVSDAEDLGIRSSARVELSYSGKKLTAIVNTSPKLIKIGMIGVSEEVKKSLGLKEENIINVEVAKFPASLQFIRNKLQGRKLSYKEICEIVKDVVEGNLSEMEIASFVTALDTRGIDLDEAASLSVAMVETGEKLKLKKKIVCDKHSIGGVAGDKTTLLLVPIVASLGLT
ncbi:MAG: thymidine phosphorylase, partial [Candidatus Aenigmarchaeota archaeon]|nr:thymidine phosphorylase [Candidatus Aenigmarchaeota archaeon]